MLPPLSAVDALLVANKQWAMEVDELEPNFFAQSAKGQHPKVLWIGCADSRVPESVLTASRPGDIFVHRNIANQFHPYDENALSVLTYAVGTVGVEHIVLAGHTHCGGAAACYKAALESRSQSQSTQPAATTTTTTTPLERWLTPLTTLAASLDLTSKSPSEALNEIITTNVHTQVANICASEPVQKAWTEGKNVSVHGWVYDIATGRIRDLGISRGKEGQSGR